jgi:hypothetical protein
MNIEEVPIKKIKAAEYNPRIDLRPGDAEYDKLKKSIDEFDCAEPLEYAPDLLSGNGSLSQKRPIIAVWFLLDVRRASPGRLQHIAGMCEARRRFARSDGCVADKAECQKIEGKLNDLLIFSFTYPCCFGIMYNWGQESHLVCISASALVKSLSVFVFGCCNCDIRDDSVDVRRRMTLEENSAPFLGGLEW